MKGERDVVMSTLMHKVVVIISVKEHPPGG